MRATKRNILRKSVTVRKNNRYARAIFGPHGSIITDDLSGNFMIAEIPDDLNIRGCDWRGALSIYYHMNPMHNSISDTSTCFFMLPDTDGLEIMPVKPSEQAVFIALFHHIYTELIQKNSYIPPFNSSINTKFEVIQNILATDTENTGFCGTKLEDLNKTLNCIQESLGFEAYKCWTDFKKTIMDLVLVENLKQGFTMEIRLAWLSKVFKNYEEILVFLMSPIDEPSILFTDIQICEAADENAVKSIYQLLMKKLDAHSIYLNTGVAPIEIEWLKELDINIKKYIQ